MTKKANRKASKATDDAERYETEDAASKSIEADAKSIIEGLNFSFTSEDSAAAPSDAERKELLQALQQFKEKLSGLKLGVSAQLQQRVAALPVGAAKGDKTESPAAYVEMKGQLLLSYLVGLAYYLVLKVEGVPVKDHPVVLRLLWIRTLLEKLKPVDQRLQYQIGKMLQWADSKTAPVAAGERGDELDVRALKPGQLSTTVDDDGSEEAEGAHEEQASDAKDDQLGAYRPPKISQVEYTGDHIAVQERAEKELERKKARLERSEFVRSLREEFTDAPKEIVGEQRSQRAEKAMRVMSERQEFEEDTMTRLRVKKADEKSMKQSLRSARSSSGGAVSMHEATADFDHIARSEAGKGGKGKGGKGKRKGGGGVLQEYHEAKRMVKETRAKVSDAMNSAPGKRKSGGGGNKFAKKSKH